MVSSAYQTHPPHSFSPLDVDLPTRTRVLELADMLRRSIHSGERGPGDRLPSERDLALQLGVARPTLRDAIKVLQAEGYVVTRRGSTGGTFVCDLDLPAEEWFERMRMDRRALEDIIDFREGVETHLARLAALRRDGLDLLEMGHAVESLDGVTSRAAFRRADARFHCALARAARSPRLADALASARSELFLPTDRLFHQEQIDDTHAGHEAILEAVIAGDGERAAQAVSAHMQSIRDHLDLALVAQPLRQGNIR